jgi:hypothetical protein
MKTRLTFTVVSLLALSLVTPAVGQWEVQGGLEALFARDSLWDQATGGEVKAVYWPTEQLGFALCTGVSQWNTDGKRRSMSATRWRSFKGDGQYVPAGVSILTRSNGSQPGPSLSFEAGLRYMVSHSDMSLTETNRVPSAPRFVDITNTYDVDLDDGLVARVAANLTWPIGPQASIFLAGGYQFDLDKGDATVDAIRLSEEVELAAFFIQLGVAIPLQ